MTNNLASCRNSGAATPKSPIDWAAFPAGEHRINCPQCGRDNRSDKTMGLTMEPSGAGVAHCFRCSYTESSKAERTAPGHALRLTRSAVTPQRSAGQTPQAQTPSKRTTLSEQGQAIWRACMPLQGTPGAAYLEARRCMLPPADGHLRFHPALRHPPTGYVGAALVALITHVRTGQAMSLHRTWIKPNGDKAAIDPPRMLLGGHSKRGGVIRLWPNDPPARALAVGEGIETCLSLAHVVTPVWALIDAGNLADLQVVEGVRALLIAQDRDPAGEQAAQTLAARWSRAGVRVRITMQSANDLNDCLQGVA